MHQTMLVVARALTLSGCLVAASVALAAPQESAAPTAAPAATATLPSIDELLARHTAAMGGKAAIDGILSMRSKGTLDSGLGVLEIDVATMAPDRSRISYATQGRRWETACDGTIAWATDPATGQPNLLSEEVRAGLSRGMDFQGLFRSPTSLFELKSVDGSETIGGVECWTVSMRSKAGEPVTGFFAKSNGLFTALKQTQKTVRGEVTMSMQVTEWQEVPFTTAAGSKETLRVAKAIETIESGRRAVGTFANFEINTLDAAHFAPPPAVQKLAEDAALRAKQTGTPGAGANR
jgi:hypothetical protein